MARGGYRQPNNPAPVSGPGMLSARTDGGAIEGMSQPVQQYTGGTYGQNKALREQQSAESMYATPELPTAIELSAPTNYPNEDISTGASWNAETSGLDINGIQGIQKQSSSSLIYRMMQFDQSGKYEAIYNKMNLG
jgi:hypothetical protein